MGAKAHVVAAQILHGLLPLPLIFGGATETDEGNEERNQGQQK